MARLTPYPFAALIRRAFRELDRHRAIFDLPARAFFTGDGAPDLSVHVHGRSASTPFGPAAGPHTQLAQNIVLSWLAGGRVIELKTVQANDAITVSRPCIDVQTVGYNVEWSQELKIEQSIDEYVKASMLIEMLAASGRLAIAPEAARTVFELSVGYDLAGITSGRMRLYLESMLDAGRAVERFRHQIPAEYARYRDLPFATRIAGGATLSTFHGCPPDQIAAIVEVLLHEFRLPVTIKFNPTLLGRDETNEVLHRRLGYSEIDVPDAAFERDTTWDEAVALVERLGRAGEAAGAGVGVKLTNTLVVRNHRTFFPGQELMYLSGPPLHVLAMHLVRRFRRRFGARVPISFSGGIDARNFPDAVALGLVPVTVCTDLLKPGGYARGHRYLRGLAARMEEAGAATIDEFVARAYGLGDAARNTEHYVSTLSDDPRYAKARTTRPPRKIGRRLRMFDCLACDKCVPVCPNDANFVFVLPPAGIPVVKARLEGGRWHVSREDPVPIREARQIATFADFCNECGNCDVFCPEDGGPYLLKPRIFGSLEAWTGPPALDGFWIDRSGDARTMTGRFDGKEYRLDAGDGRRVSFSGSGFAVRFDERDPERTLAGDARVPVDLTIFYVMNALRRAVLDDTHTNYVNSLG